MATKEQVEEIKKLLETVKVEDETIDKWFTKADVTSWDEMKAKEIVGCINFCKKKLADLSPTKEKEKVNV